MQAQNAMMLSSIFGPLLMIMGVWMLFYHENLVKVCTSIKNTPASQHLMGYINMLVGLTIINHYNIWAWNLALLITLLGWLMLVRGLLTHFLPQLYFKISMNDPSWLRIKGIIPLAWGLGLCWLAFWMRK